MFVWKIFCSFPKLQKNAAFKLKLSPHNRQNCNTRSIVESIEIDLAKQKLLILAQSESFPVDVNALLKKQSLKKSSRISSFSPFIGPGGLVRSTGRIRRHADAAFNVKNPINLDSRHLLVMMRLIFFHQKNHHQSVDILRAVIQF